MDTCFAYTDFPLEVGVAESREPFGADQLFRCLDQRFAGVQSGQLAPFSLVAVPTVLRYSDVRDFYFTITRLGTIRIGFAKFA